ncbi:MAG: dimethylsulfoniopropionate demethylase [Rhodobacteraceae bacterium]|nr:dimethylsulfoniopropionate demethylase [Paracoccaceae bacterium]
MSERHLYGGLEFSPTTRIRLSPFWPGVQAAGVSTASIYNHVLFPCVFRSLEEDYRHLKNHVQLWDVSCQRQVELSGPDAALLARMIAPRDISALDVGQCCYVPAVDRGGKLLNDPVLIKLAEDRFWFSVADSDLILFASGVAAGAGLAVRVHEPDVSPLAIQGPKAEQLMRGMFGEEISGLKFFRGRYIEFDGKNHLVTRSGYSKQGGFEIYVEGAEHGMPIWNALMQAGAEFQLRAGGPNYIERVEGGLLSYGGDITSEHTPYEGGLEAYCDAEAAFDCLGRDALLRELESGPKRQIRCLTFAGGKVPPCDHRWELSVNGRFAGQVSAAVWSPELGLNIGIGMVESEFWDAGSELCAELPGESRTVTVQAEFFN